ncbi:MULTISPECIES: hypothetical protein [Okeania]|uniref:hypothetical protein n=1 Tax=Okeania TaxID=1458928 RepID=UPI000F525CC5|nr:MULTISPECIES: hypothetical protein [Okeania]NEP04400.1 hypothetical protein [Okeania sp. SIO4D6]NEP42845.1 hypothetical protein [Okeania sp. SIO2H7]NET15977.1 hypothetical protein [Okeania sp. SIO1H6]NEP73063.1 hypothetical protein [Okeania sp. SIO2G5]NEP93926.1 hypothetical protein [Okeania sp. SIO2F5]
MAELSKEEMRERLGNIDKIRDIIFGPKLREYENRFEKLESELSSVKQETKNQIEQVKSAFSTELQATVDSIEKKIRNINLNIQNTQEDVVETKQQIERVNRKIITTKEALNEIIDNQTTSLREDLSQTREKLQNDVSHLKTQIFEELEKRFSLLKDVKVSRDDLAEIMFEVGMRMKKTEFVSELKEAADKDLEKELLISDNHHK